MPLTDFDRYFSNFPEPDAPGDFESFWKDSLAELKRINLELSVKEIRRDGYANFKVYNVTFQGFAKTLVHAVLLKPARAEKTRAVIYIHDYNRYSEIPRESLDKTLSYLFISMRGHHVLKKNPDADTRSPGYMIENILDPRTYYVKAVYLDAFRSIDALRLIDDIDCSAIGIAGKGLGAAAAAFCAASSDRISCAVLETPAFCNLPLSQNRSSSELTEEINGYIAASRAKKKQVKDNLTYFDILNFADKITVPVLVTSGFKDTLSLPDCIMGFFNRLQTEKTIEIYPEDGNSAGGAAQSKKSVKWLKKHLSRQA